MKVLCNVCETRPATFMCFTEEAAMCAECDGSIHTSSSKKHSRVQLLAPSKPTQPKCDICQVDNAYVVCREDRAVLCRRCDLSIHTATKLAEKHQRFLLSGVTLALHPVRSGSEDRSEASEDRGEENEPSTSKSTNHLVPDLGPGSSLVTNTKQFAANNGKNDKFMATSVPHWRVDELLDIPGLADGYNVRDIDALSGDMGDLDYDLSCFLEVPDMNNNVGEGSNPVNHPESYSSDDGLAVVPDMDNNDYNKRRRT